MFVVEVATTTMSGNLIMKPIAGNKHYGSLYLIHLSWLEQCRQRPINVIQDGPVNVGTHLKCHSGDSSKSFIPTEIFTKNKFYFLTTLKICE